MILKKSILASIAVILSTVPYTAAQQPAFKPGRVIVKFRNTGSSDPSSFYGVKRAFDRLGVTGSERLFKNVADPTTTAYSQILGKYVDVPDLYPIYTLHIPEDTDPLRAANALRKLPEVQYAHPDYIPVMLSTSPVIPNDIDFSKQWGLHNTGQTGTEDSDIDAPEAWAISTGSTTEIVVAVIDTGVDWDHPDIESQVWTNSGETPGNAVDDDGNGYVDDIRGWDFYSNDSDPMDEHGHGTHCSGVISARTNNGTGIAGVSWYAKIMPVKMFGPGGWGSGDAGLCIKYAADNGAHILSNSWGYTSPDIFPESIKEAIDYANAKGCLVVFSQGNSYTEEKYYPGAYEGVVGVVATGPDDTKAVYSTYGSWADVSAPGGAYVGADEDDIYSTLWDNTYGYMAGTSMACPHVAGLAALVWAYNGGPSVIWDAEQVRRQIIFTSDNIYSKNPGYEGKMGKGRINAHRALTETLDITPPTGAPTDPVDEGAICAISTTSFSWSIGTATDTESGIESYQLRVVTDNTDPDNTIVMDDDVGDVNIYVLSVENNTTYYARVRAVNGHGLTGSWSGWSDGIYVDTSLPDAPVIDPIDYVWRNSTYTVSWSAYSSAIGSATYHMQETSQKPAFFSDDIESGAGDWESSGLWNISSHRYHGGSNAWYYGVPGDWSYDTGYTNSGYLVSEYISLPASGKSTLGFWTWLETEEWPPYDAAMVSISEDGSSWDMLLVFYTTDDVWEHKELDISAYNGKSVKVKFSFDTGDPIFNDYEGWYVDDIYIDSFQVDVSTQTAETSYTTPSAKQEGSYFYRVRAKDTVKPWGPWSQIEQVDVISPPPGAVADLEAQTGASNGEVVLSWTEPGADGTYGNASGGRYMVKGSYAVEITSSNWGDPSHKTYAWNADTVIGRSRQKILDGLKMGATWWFAMKLRDEWPYDVSWSDVDTSTPRASAMPYGTLFPANASYTVERESLSGELIQLVVPHDSFTTPTYAQINDFDTSSEPAYWADRRADHRKITEPYEFVITDDWGEPLTASDFRKKVGVRFYYPPDTHIARRNQLRVFRLSEEEKIWKGEPDFIIDPDSSYIEARVAHLSVFSLMAAVTDDFSDTLVYPNPFRPKSAVEGSVKFINLPSEFDLRIFNTAGEIVSSSSHKDSGGAAAWDGRNDSGKYVATGIYIYLLTDPDGRRKTGKISLIR